MHNSILQQDQQKKKKVNKKSKVEDTTEIVIPKPSLLDTLPIQIPRLIWFLIISVPSTVGYLKTTLKEKIEEAQTVPEPEPEPEPITVKPVRKRNKFILPEGPNFETQTTSFMNKSEQVATPPISGGLWTDDDLAELIRLVKKYPQGAAKRWESIADALGRSVAEVTYMSNKMKENGYRMPSDEPEEIVPIKVKQKTKKEVDVSDNVKKWSQEQQKCLEDALAKFPKGCNDRWDRIAEHVPEKSKVSQI